MKVIRMLEAIPGSSELIAWFGYWPTFHDAEVLRIELDRSGLSTIRVHAFEATSKVNSQGEYGCVKHVVVTFVLEEIKTLQLDSFNRQNVLNGVLLEHTSEGYQLTLSGCYGVGIILTINRMRIELEPGPPPDSQYRVVSLPGDDAAN